MRRSTVLEIVAIFIAFLLTGIALILTISKEVPIGQIIGWSMIIFSITGIAGLLVYVFIVQRLNDISVTVERSVEEIRTHVKIIQDIYELATKELLQEAAKLGLEMVYKTRTDIENEIIDKLIPSARREVKFLGVCISIPNRMPELNTTIEERAIEGVSFRFLFLNRPQKGEFNFYEQRAYDESYPNPPVGTLEGETAKYRKVFEIVQRTLQQRQGNMKGKIETAEYKAFPYMSLIIIDDIMYVGPYLFGLNCPNMPMFKIRKKEGGIYKTYWDHFDALWRHAKEIERGTSPD